MIEVKQYVGIDVSQDTIDVYGEFIGHHKLANADKGFQKLLSLLDRDDCCVMEASGATHQRLAMFLFEQDIHVSVLNPLIVHRFIQMKLKQTKTDKSDARMIALYADTNDVELWEPAPEEYRHCMTLMGMVTMYLKQVTQLNNKKHYYLTVGSTIGSHMRSLKLQLKRLKVEIEKLEAEIAVIIKKSDGELLSLVQTVPGVGKKTATFLIAYTIGLRKFHSAKQLISYLGLAPTERSSGTSVHGARHISKTGNAYLRKLLFVCSLSAVKANPQCKALYDRLIAKGKSKKLALIAVANKLLKQIFSISESRIPYDPLYRSTRIA
jgi:transposase